MRAYVAGELSSLRNERINEYNSNIRMGVGNDEYKHEHRKYKGSKAIYISVSWELLSRFPGTHANSPPAHAVSLLGNGVVSTYRIRATGDKDILSRSGSGALGGNR